MRLFFEMGLGEGIQSHCRQQYKRKTRAVILKIPRAR
jgi:hypothetical protein